KTRAVVHTTAQPAHNWAAREPQTDVTVNTNGTLNLLEAARENCPESPFIFTSTNKVYGDTHNSLPLRERETRWEIESGHKYEQGIPETMSIDATKHSRSEEHTSELQSLAYLVCRLLLEKKKK